MGEITPERVAAAMRRVEEIALKYASAGGTVGYMGGFQVALDLAVQQPQLATAILQSVDLMAVQIDYLQYFQNRAHLVELIVAAARA